MTHATKNSTCVLSLTPYEDTKSPFVNKKYRIPSPITAPAEKPACFHDIISDLLPCFRINTTAMMSGITT